MAEKFRAKKSLAQHFLTSKQAVRDAVHALRRDSFDTILEIGPGKGVLTEALLETGLPVVAVEADKDLVRHLEKRFAKEIESGALNLSLEQIQEHDLSRYAGKEYAIVANIPYYITGLILRMFLTSQYQPRQMVLMVQKEVAQRIVARDGKESLLSLSVKSYGSPRIVSYVSRRYFSPPPEVDSAIISIEDISRDFFKIHEVDEKEWFDLLHQGFAHKRKQLANNLKGSVYGGGFNKLTEKDDIDPKIRAEDMEIKWWVQVLKLSKSTQNGS